MRFYYTFKKCTFKEIAFPILFVPFLSRASEKIGKKILFKFGENRFLLNFNMNISSEVPKVLNCNLWPESDN